MRHIKIRRTPTGLVEVDVTRDAEGLLDRLAELHGTDPDIVEDLLVQLGTALQFRDRAREEGHETRATLGAAQADAARDELVARMGAVHSDGMPPVTVEIAPADALSLASELTAAAGPRPAGLMRGAA
ncbi:hypothetical protein [Streptomyces sioyaensis]|uniref:hypothetical protein n=1 Tax=Streptomyces sioyaensis TaxID=67364 RepID=UPI003D73FA3E